MRCAHCKTPISGKYMAGIFFSGKSIEELLCPECSGKIFVHGHVKKTNPIIWHLFRIFKFIPRKGVALNLNRFKASLKEYNAELLELLDKSIKEASKSAKTVFLTGNQEIKEEIEYLEKQLIDFTKWNGKADYNVVQEELVGIITDYNRNFVESIGSAIAKLYGHDLIDESDLSSKHDKSKHHKEKIYLAGFAFYLAPRSKE